MELLVEMPGAVPPPPETWLQCDACGKWRRVPSTTAAAEQPERWECSLNPEVSPYISLYLPLSPYISLYLPIPPRYALLARRQGLALRGVAVALLTLTQP